jgi:hypothetical protein
LAKEDKSAAAKATPNCPKKLLPVRAGTIASRDLADIATHDKKYSILSWDVCTILGVYGFRVAGFVYFTFISADTNKAVQK